MATTRTVVRKNGIPVKRFWHEKVTQKARDTYFTTTYPVYFQGYSDKVWSLTDGAAPRTLENAIAAAHALVESPEQPQTTATVYELRAVYRVGTELDWKLKEQEDKARRTANTGNTQE
jgi:hypothetical protein